MYKDKVRIAMTYTVRIADCDSELMRCIDQEVRERGLKSRVQLLEELSGNQLKNKQDVKELRKKCKSQGFKTIELWLAHCLGCDDLFLKK